MPVSLAFVCFFCVWVVAQFDCAWFLSPRIAAVRMLFSFCLVTNQINVIPGSHLYRDPDNCRGRDERHMRQNQQQLQQPNTGLRSPSSAAAAEAPSAHAKQMGWVDNGILQWVRINEYTNKPKTARERLSGIQIHA